MGKRTIALDIGASSVTLAEYLAGGGGELVLVKYGRAELASQLDADNIDLVLAPAIRALAAEKGIHPGKAHVAVSGQLVFSRCAEIPSRPGSDRYSQLVRYEIEQNIPFPAEEMVCDSQFLGDTAAGESSVLVVAAKSAQMEAVAAAVTEAGFPPETLDVSPLALSSAIEAYADTGSDECRIVLDIGAKTASLVILEGSRMYSRSITVAGNLLSKEIAQALSTGMAEAEEFKVSKAYVSAGGVEEDSDPETDTVAKVCRAVMTRIYSEIVRSLNFYRSQQGGGDPVKMYLSGGTALLPGIAEFFASALSIEVEVFDPFGSIGLGGSLLQEEVAADAVFLAPTAGLALRSVKMARFNVNLLPRAVLDARQESSRVWFVAVGSAALVAAAACLFSTVLRGREVIGRQLEAVEEKLSVLRKTSSEIEKSEAECKAVFDEAEALRALMQKRSLAVARLNAVRQAIGDDLWIDRWEGDRVTIRGWRDRVAAFTEYVASKTESGKTRPASEIVVDRLKANAAVASSRVVEAKYFGKGDSIEQFTVEILFK